ncbi:MAG: hypothetical protein RSE41_03330 [Clostridia bacterium]
MLNYIAICIVPLMILITIVIGVKEKKDVYELFIQGVIEGLKVVYKIFPYVLGITIAIGLFKSSGLLQVITIPITGILNYCNIPIDILPLMILRPLSGSASMTMVIDILKNYGPDSDIRKISFSYNGIY